MPADPVGSTGVLGKLRITADGQTYAYCYDRTVSDLFVCEGLGR